MRVGILTIDSRGGVQPLLALGLALRDAGHDIRVVAPADFVALVAETGLEFHPLDFEVKAYLEGGGAGVGSRREQLRRARTDMPRQVTRWMSEALPALEGVDLVISGLAAAMVGRSVAERLGVPCIDAILTPTGPATTDFPAIFASRPPRWLGGLGRWGSHVLTNLMIEVGPRRAVAAARVSALGLPRRVGDVDRRLPVLYGYSRHLVPPPRSWEKRRHVVGYWTMPLAGCWSPSPELAAFIAAGPPPVCIGFGSMPTDDPAQLAELSVAAARRAGLRTVLLSGWAGLDVADAEDIHVAASVPHEWLFPRMAAVVHHGGAGTTGAAVRAGIPSVVVPWGADQPFWADRLVAAGVAAAPIPRASLDVERLAAALTEVSTDDAMRRRARALGASVAAEDGSAVAVRVLTEAGVLR
jgi:sterol 3beta-glucosyltransferase